MLKALNVLQVMILVFGMFKLIVAETFGNCHFNKLGIAEKANSVYYIWESF